jgi:hypothetical protein
MSDSFNPYLEFLDLGTAPKCPTYYELLGISNSDECTHDLVENGRLTALAKMRAFKPGANAAVWAAVLDEVALASTTLLDLDLKATYDNQLTTGEVPNELDLVQRLGPIERVDASSTASAESASPVDSMAPSHLQSGAATSVRVAATHPVVPTAVAVPVDATIATPVPVEVATPIATAAPVEVATPIATAAPVEVATPIAQTVAPLPDMAESFGQTQSINEINGRQIMKDRRRKSRNTGSPLLLYTVIGLFLITGGVAFVFLGRANVQKAVSMNPDSDGASDSQLVIKPSKPNGTGTTVKPDLPNVEQSKPRPPAPPIDKPLNPLPPNWDPQNPEPNSPTDSGGSRPPAKPMPTEPKPAPKPIEAAELERLTAALQLGRAALSERNLDITTEQLAIAKPLARSGEPKKAFIRLKTMHEFMVQFMRLSNEAIDQYESGSEIKIGTSTIVVVVEASPQDLTIRVAGNSRTYLRNQLSLGLAIGIADANFEESKYKSTLKAAFVITQTKLRESDVEKAREFWKMGPESIELFDGFISDDYEFASE